MSAPPLNQMPYSEQPKHSDTLTIWLFVAAVFHVLLLSVGFEMPKPTLINKAIEVTLVNSAIRKAPENAKYFAQNNQIAAGSEEQKPLPLLKKTPHAGHDEKTKKQTQAATTQTAIERRLITQKNAEKKIASAEKHENTAENGDSSENQPELSMEELDKQIAQLEIKLQHQRENAEKTNIKSINSISAHKYEATRYIKDWERKVERNGNLNLPEINGEKRFSGVVTMDVGVNVDGSLYDIKIIKSSGIPKLDKAAKQIVEDNAPFAPLPALITEQLDVLRIRREFIFSDDGTISTSTEDE